MWRTRKARRRLCPQYFSSAALVNRRWGRSWWKQIIRMMTLLTQIYLICNDMRFLRKYGERGLALLSFYYVGSFNFFSCFFPRTPWTTSTFTHHTAELLTHPHTFWHWWSSHCSEQWQAGTTGHPNVFAACLSIFPVYLLLCQCRRLWMWSPQIW